MTNSRNGYGSSKIRDLELFKPANFGPIEGIAKQYFGNETLQFSDADGWHECNGRVVIVEWKHWEPGYPDPSGWIDSGGQARGFSGLVKSPLNTVIVAWGDAEAGIPYFFMVWGQMKRPILCTLEFFAAVLAHWREWAERQDAPFTERDQSGLWLKATEPWRYNQRLANRIEKSLRPAPIRRAA